MLPRSCPGARVVERGCLGRCGIMSGKAGRRAPGVLREGCLALSCLFPLTDHKAFYVIFTWDQEAQIYELVAQTVSERKK